MTLSRMPLIPGKGTDCCGHAAPDTLALMIEFRAGMNGLGGENLPTPAVSWP